ncbi:hypothetical protein PSm6_04420 [Pseudomonas solani]|uniref:Cyclic nucleotide-binding domain-containing protein n=1 Tax=Pseudomonas solani TaxID=2731552 RepID=A0ABM7L3A6_9PSED|nr:MULTISPECIES: hypothetical protein [Pseudomonas]EQM66550.1 hypothetical protein L682_25230 [Pseudomonas alcaligenes OT 69]MDN4144685.1 hypothetical protein [Pseudomonas tohonis]BCD84035.1 hypothetical protein PSm6_04420 [Pseudomonas solani]
MLNLDKIIGRGTWRYVGQRVQGLQIQAIPIAGKSIELIAKKLGGTAYQIGRIHTENAFVVQKGVLSLLYVRPDYRGYRRTAGLVFAPCSWKVDYDHALSRNLAGQLGYAYVLMLRVVPRINRSHGHLERNLKESEDVPDICFADERIRGKWIGRSASRLLTPPGAFSANQTTPYGLTLRQAGQWGFAMGVEDDDRDIPGLKPITDLGPRT